MSENIRASKGKKRQSSASPPAKKHRKTTTTTASPSTPKHFSYKDLSPSPQSSPNPSSTPKNPLNLTHHTGSLFTAPKHTVLIHACNTQGSWGAGIASTFKATYPNAYTIYRSFCTKEHNPKTSPVPTGTALLISPVDHVSNSGDDDDDGEGVGKQHWIGCLFTSAKYGRAKDKKDVIVENTKAAMEMLLRLLEKADGVQGMRMCKINSGKFGVEWERTEKVLNEIEVSEGSVESVEVWAPEEEE